MSWKPVITFVGVGVLLVGASTFLGLSPFPTVEFSFAAPDGKGSMIYRCQMLETAEKTEAAAHAAHLYFAPALIENARMQGKAMASSMSPTRRSSEIIPELEQIEASFYARRKELQREIQGQFGCGYKGSI